MNKTGKPVEDYAKIRKLVEDVMNGKKEPAVDLYDTAIAFKSKSDSELRKSAWLFGLMNKHWLVGIGSSIGLAAIKMHLPFVETVVKNTIFDQFCGGTTLLECQKNIERLATQHTQSILDYGVEAKEREEDFNHTMNETIRAIEFASQTASVPVVSSKITGMARFALLEAVQNGGSLSAEQQTEYQSVLKRLDSVCHVAATKGVSVYFDAEESWIQDALDHLVNTMMKRYNKEKAVVSNTFQLYRTDRLQYLIDSFNHAQKEGYVLGAKLVRGAYMEKERERARNMGYPSPIHETKEATDDAYNTAVRFCVDNYEHIASSNASHNAISNLLQAELIIEKGIERNHPHLNFSQLYGMSDNLTFNLAHAGFNVAKYVPYGPVREVVPYLIRRAQENTSVTGDMSREYQLVHREIKRRGLS
jgi:proline dehydrogenase